MTLTSSKPTDDRAIHFWVSGRVQGVYFRQSTLNQARQLGLTGWVKNLPDGRVEGVACGPQQALEQLTQWLHQGPPVAKVTDLKVEPEASTNFGEFSVLS